MESKPGVAQLIVAHAERVGVSEFVRVCIDLLAGADRTEYVDELRSLTGHGWEQGSKLFDERSWPNYWVRSWGARGLLHVWDDIATEAVLAGLADEHWRPVEMCLKVVARHEVGGVGDAVALLVDHELPRVRIRALRALAVVGDTQHLDLLVNLLRDAEPEVRRQAERTLESIAKRLDIEPRPFPRGQAGSHLRV